MQSVLSIDLTSEPARAEIIEVEGRVVRLIESATASLDGLLSDPTESSSTAESTDTQPSQATPNTAQTPSTTETPFETLIKGLKNPWTSAILIVPPEQYLSLHIELPFNDQKQVSKILPLEVQDRVPFELNEFVVEHRILGARPSLTNGASSENDIHVSLIPKTFLHRVLALCKKGNIEPLIVTSPAAVIGAALYVAPEFFSKQCAFVVERAHSLFLGLVHDGVLKSDRIIKKSALTDSRKKEILVDVRLSAAAFEQRYGITLEKIYLISENFSKEQIQHQLGRPVENVSLRELFKEAENVVGGDGLATLGSVFVQDIDPPQILSNFRVHEFSYSPRLTEVLRGLKVLTPYLIAVLFALLISMGGIYYSRYRYLHQVREALSSEIRTALPTVDIPAGLEVEALRGQVRLLEEQLKDLGSLSQLSPLDTLAELTRDIGAVTQSSPAGRNLSIRTISIKSSNRIRIEGTTPDYGAVDELERALRAKKYRANAQAKDQVPGTNDREFVLEIIPKE